MNLRLHYATKRNKQLNSRIAIFILLLTFCQLASAEEDIMQQTSDTGRIQPIFKNGKYANRTPEVKVKAWNAFVYSLKNKAETKPKKYLPYDSVIISKAFPESKEGLHITWLGHSSFLMQIDGVRILLDPVFSNNVSPVPMFSVKRFQKEVPVNAEILPFIDAVFISHNHYDHLNRQTINDLAPNVGFFFTPPGVGGILREWGIDSAKIREYEWWQEGVVKGLSGNTLKFACTPAYHFSGRGPFDWNKTLWASWVFIGATKKAYYSGDSSYDVHFKQIGYHYGPFDLVFMENGQYSVNWPSSHITPEDGVKAHLELKGKYLLPMHWGSFSLAPHSWQEPAERISKEALAKGVKLLTPRVGQTLFIGEEEPKTEAWWR